MFLVINMFKYTLDNKRYHTSNYFFKTKFGKKVFKIPLDINSPCPNKLSGGCIFCSNSSSASISDSSLDIIAQFNKVKRIMEQKWPDGLYIPYFQSGSNTYIDINIMKNYINQLLDQKNVVGIDIATRPDLLTPEWLDYLEKLNKRTFLIVELGLQSSNEYTLQFINRGHTVEDFTKAVRELQKRKIFVVAHIINGLPTDTEEDMLNTVKYLNTIKIDAIKIHMLFVNKNTTLGILYQKQPFSILTKEQYIDIVIKQLQHLSDNIVIMRITGDPIKEDLIAPDWLVKKVCVLNDIDKEMKKRNVYQGDLL